MTTIMQDPPSKIERVIGRFDDDFETNAEYGRDPKPISMPAKGQIHFKMMAQNLGQQTLDLTGRVAKSTGRDVLSAVFDLGKTFVGYETKNPSALKKEANPEKAREAAQQEEKDKIEFRFVGQRIQETNQLISKQALKLKRENAARVAEGGYTRQEVQETGTGYEVTDDPHEAFQIHKKRIRQQEAYAQQKKSASVPNPTAKEANAADVALEGATGKVGSGKGSLSGINAG